MAKITYDGMELEEQLYSEPTIINDSREAIVWNDYANKDREIVLSYDPRSKYPVRSNNDMIWKHFAFIPENPAPRRATNRELAKWLAQGNGEWGISKFGVIDKAEIGWFYDTGYEKQTLQSELRVRKWDDTEWHEPTVDYMGFETNTGEKE